jgi:integrase
MPAVRKRGDHYFVDYYYQGKRYRKILPTSNKRIAEDYLASLLNKRIKGDLGLGIDIHYLEFKDKYLEYCSKENRPSTHARYITIFKDFEKFLGARTNIIFISQIDRDLINSYKHTRAREVSPHTVNIELRGLRAFLNEARKRKFLTASPFEDVHLLETPERKIRKLSFDELKSIIKEARERFPFPNKDSFVPALITYIYTGCRRSELINLRWEQIDFDSKVIHIYSHDTFTTKSGKMKSIAMHNEVYNELQKLEKKSDYVFTSPTGKKYEHRFYRKFKDVVKALNLNWVRIHDLRHTLASHLAEMGVSYHTIATILGHSNISTTFIYQHTAPADVKAAINLLPSL